MKNIIFTALLLILIGGWVFAKNILAPQGKPVDGGAAGYGVVGLQAKDVDEFMLDDDVFLLDVHIPEQKHIAGTDEFIPYNQLKENLDKLPTNKDQPILVYCRSGSMSKLASEELVKMGYKKVYDLLGGIKAYNFAKLNTDEVND